MLYTPRFVALYGSLMEGVGSPAPPAGVWDGLRKTDTIEMAGDLYVVRGTNYPGFVLRVGGPKIEADLFLIRDEATFRALDEWEEASDAPDAPYRRRLATVYHRRQSVTFWVYEGNHPLEMREYVDATCWRDYFNANFATSEPTLQNDV